MSYNPGYNVVCPRCGTMYDSHNGHSCHATNTVGSIGSATPASGDARIIRLLEQILAELKRMQK